MRRSREKGDGVQRIIYIRHYAVDTPRKERGKIERDSGGIKEGKRQRSFHREGDDGDGG